MSTVTLEPDFANHPKVAELSDAAFRAHVSVLCWCAQYETDGRVTRALASRYEASGVLGELVSGRLWVGNEDGSFSIKDYLQYNPSKEELEKSKEFKSRRRKINLNPSLCAAIKKRDCDRCRYCGVEVDWNNRRGPVGGTYDHVRPISRGGSDEEPNLVVCCRNCNSGKCDRTPEEAGMVLLPEPSQVSGRKPPSPGQKTDGKTADLWQENSKSHKPIRPEEAAVTEQTPDPELDLPTKVRSVRARWRRVPADWSHRPEHAELARSLGVDLESELPRFRDHEFRDPKTDADAAFRTWLRNAKRFSPAPFVRRTGPVQPSHGRSGFEDT